MGFNNSPKEDEFNEEEFLNSLNDNSFGMNDFGGSFNSFSRQDEKNLIEWQLDFSKDLERLRNLLSGYEKGYDEKGNLTFIPPKDPSNIPFNQHGVATIMRIIEMYLNKNTVLSNHEPKRIKQICAHVGEIIADEIYASYEDLGMDTTQKQSKYTSIVFGIIVEIESAFNRAIRGGERESLRTARTVNQSEPLGGGMRPQLPRARKFGLLRPSSWI